MSTLTLAAAEKHKRSTQLPDISGSSTQVREQTMKETHQAEQNALAYLQASRNDCR